MNFEKRMQKRGNERLDLYTPNLYENKKHFPLWAKIVVPVGSVVIASSIALAVIIPIINNNNYFVKAPSAKRLVTLDDDIVSRTASKTLSAFDELLQNVSKKDYLISPASFLLAATGVAAVSDGVDLSSFGISDPSRDVKSLLESWNFVYEENNEYNPQYCRFDSGVLHQQVGPTYRFDKNKQKEISDSYIATSVASLEDYHKQATSYFHDTIGFSIPIPDPNLKTDGVITYGAIRMKDYVPKGLISGMREFTVDSKTSKIDSYIFGQQYAPYYLKHYQSKNYQAFELKMSYTSLLIVLPNEGVNLEDISISEAYSSFNNNKEYVYAYGYVPYFHLTEEEADLTKFFPTKGRYYSKLLSGGVFNDLGLDKVIQSSDFEFGKYGVSGESITVISFSSTSATVTTTNSIEINVNRPFYAISLKDGFPLFVNKVNNPGK